MRIRPADHTARSFTNALIDQWHDHRIWQHIYRSDLAGFDHRVRPLPWWSMLCALIAAGNGWNWAHDTSAWRLLWAAIALCYASMSVRSFINWRKQTWDSPLPPTSKSSPPSPFHSNCRSALQYQPSSSQSANPSPPNLWQHNVRIGANVIRGLPTATRPLSSLPVDAPVVGYRSWVVTPTGLRSLNNSHNHHWDRGINRAVCDRALARSFFIDLPDDHRAPDARCSCGMYGWRAPSFDDRGQHDRVFGAVLAWGKIVRHGQEGFRAEYMRPICLARPEREDYREMMEAGSAPCPKAAFANGEMAVLLPGNVNFTVAASANMTYQIGATTIFANGHVVPEPLADCRNCGQRLKHAPSDEAWQLILDGRTALAAMMGLPVVAMEHLEAYAKEFGQSIKDLKPKESA